MLTSINAYYSLIIYWFSHSQKNVYLHYCISNVLLHRTRPSLYTAIFVPRDCVSPHTTCHTSGETVAVRRASPRCSFWRGEVTWPLRVKKRGNFAMRTFAERSERQIEYALRDVVINHVVGIRKPMTSPTKTSGTMEMKSRFLESVIHNTSVVTVYFIVCHRFI